jgi:hypothetical protein
MTQRIRVLITVKAYPTLSERYRETVCVAGIRTDGESPAHVRLFPVPFRDLDEGKQFAKYDVVEVDVVEHAGDNRPESQRPRLDTLKVVDHLDSSDGWKRRSKLVAPLIAPSLCEIKRRQELDRTSLGVFRPAQVTDFKLEPAQERSAGLEAMASQINMFDPERKKLEALPYKFSYSFTCDDNQCRGHKMGLIDWEVGAAYLSWRRRYTAEELPGKLRQKWFEEICGPKNDPHLFVGNVHQHPRTFMLLGVFYPPKGMVERVLNQGFQDSLF